MQPPQSPHQTLSPLLSILHPRTHFIHLLLIPGSKNQSAAWGSLMHLCSSSNHENVGREKDRESILPREQLQQHLHTQPVSFDLVTSVQRCDQGEKKQNPSILQQTFWTNHSDSGYSAMSQK
jgi:hypothetical protein